MRDLPGSRSGRFPLRSSRSGRSRTPGSRWRALAGPLSVSTVLALAWMACTPAVRAPVPVLELGSPAPESSCVVLFLPGRRSRAEDFRRHGFGEIARQAGIEARLVAADAHLGYYRERVLVERIRHDLVSPARRRGVARLWVVGVSLGGVGALLLDRELETELEGLVLLAPYLGEEEILDAVEAAGGPREWRPGEEEDGEEVGRRIWRGLRRLLAADAPLWLGYGRDDRMARGHRLLAAALPQDRVVAVEGGHDWDAWTRIWREIAGRAPICAPPASPSS